MTSNNPNEREHRTAQVKIRLIFDIPVDPALGLTEGRILDAEYHEIVERHSSYYLVKIDDGSPVKIWAREAEVVSEEPEEPEEPEEELE